MCYKPVEIPIKKAITPFESVQRYMLVNCRQCLECRQARAKEWALRCLMESSKYEKSCFVTLTYAKSPVHLVKKDLQDFLKRLRKSIAPLKIRYFSCGEYGSQRLRPHYHVLIYGYDFPDKFKDGVSNSGHALYNSESLERLWGHGLTTIQELTLNSAAYCALYSSQHKSKLPPHLRDYPEFNTMSQGLGIDVLLSNLDTYMKTDEIWLDGKKHNIPQTVFNKRFNDWQKLTDERYLSIKAERVKKGRQNEKCLLSKVQDDDFEMYAQKQYRKENAVKRLTKQI